MIHYICLLPCKAFCVSFILVTYHLSMSSMYSMAEHDTHDSHYTPNNYATSSITSSSNILNYDPSSPHHGSEHNTDFMDVQYKREPSTPTMTVPHQDYNYPTTFTPSPSLSGSESPRTPSSYYQGQGYPPTSLDGGERLTVPYPAPTPPLSATINKDQNISIPDPDVKFSNEQIDCICDTLQQRKDMSTLGKLLLIPISIIV